MIRHRRICTGLLLLFVSAAFPLGADTVRVATFNTELQRDGPGLLLRDILRGDDPQVLAVLAVLGHAKADIIALQGIDWDYDGQAVTALTNALRAQGLDYPYHYAPPPNRGRATGIDLNGDGRRGGPEDAQAYGAFLGEGAMAVLSRFPIETPAAQDLSDTKWRDLPLAELPTHRDGTPYPSEKAQNVQRLSSGGHWIVPIELPDGKTLTLMTYHAAPPVFDGPEDRNGLRNRDETRFWQWYLDGLFGPAPDERFVIAGDANLDPVDGDGRREAILGLLADQRVQDPRPASPGAALAPDQGHAGPDALDTVDWQDRPGRLRVSYVLPSVDIKVRDAGVIWPAPADPLAISVRTASRHRLVWVDVDTTD